MTYVIALPCVDVKDKSCIEECPVDCIYEGDRMMYINLTSVLIAALANQYVRSKRSITKTMSPHNGTNTKKLMLSSLMNSDRQEAPAKLGQSQRIIPNFSKFRRSLRANN